MVRACRDAGFDVRSCSRSEGVDLRDGEAFGLYLKAVAPDCVVHAAAHVGGIGYVAQHAIEVFHDNLAIAAGLMRGIHTAGITRLVTVMPNCTYPGTKELYREDEWWDGPIHDSVLMYGLPRKTLWGLCKTYGDATGMGSAHLIMPNLYGPGDHLDPLRSHALGALIRKIVEAKRESESSVEIWGTGQPVREWMFVEDAAGAIVRFLQTLDRGGEVLEGHPIFNVGIGKGISIAGLAELIGAVAKWEGSFEYDKSRPDGARQKLLDGSRFAELVGWKPEVSLEVGVGRTVAWFEEQLQKESAYAHS